MKDLLPTFRTLFRELKRRRVYRVGALYLLGAFGVLQAADLAQGALLLPETFLPVLVIVIAAGLPVALALAWAFDITPEGVRAEGGPGLADYLGGPVYGRLAVAGIVAVLSGAAGWTGWSLWLGEDSEPELTGSTDLDPTRIAVLYFDDLSREQDLGYLADGLTEGLLNELAQIDALEVISRSGVKPFRDRAVPLDSIVRALQAGSLVEGSVTRSGDRVRVTVQLIDGTTEAHLSSRTWDREETDLLALQDSTVAEVARVLRQRLGQEVALRETRRRASSEESWTLVQRARRLKTEARALWGSDAEASRRLLGDADSLLAIAEAVDGVWEEPSLVRGDVARDLAVLDGARAGVPDSAGVRRALEHVERALQQWPASSAALALRGRLLYDLTLSSRGSVRARQREEAEAVLRRAVDLDPAAAEAWWVLSLLMLDLGRFAEAQRAAERGLEADMFLEIPQSVLHQVYYAALQFGPTDEARRFCDEGRRRFPDSSQFVTCQLFVLASFPQAPPDVDRAWRLADSLVALTSERNRAEFHRFGRIQVAKVAARAGLADSARAVLDRATVEPVPESLLYDEAHARLLMDDRDGALRVLSRHIAIHEDAAYIAEDWWFEALRDDPRFQELVGGGGR